MSAFPALGTAFGIVGIAAGALVVVRTAFRAPLFVTVEEVAPAVVIMLASVFAGLSVVFIAGLASVAGGELT